MRLVKENLERWTGRADLYEHDGKYYVVSTIIFGEGVPPELQAALIVGNIAGKLLGYDVAEPGEEETVVFDSNEHGDNLGTAYFDDSFPIHVSGPGSRDKVLDQLAAQAAQSPRKGVQWPALHHRVI